MIAQMYQKLSFLFLLIILPMLVFGQSDNILEIKIGTRIYKVQKQFDKMYPGNPNPEIVDIRFDRIKDALGPLRQKSYRVNQYNRKGQLVFDPENILYVKYFDGLTLFDQAQVKKWTKQLEGINNPKKLYYELVCYFAVPLELMQELPAIKDHGDATLKKFRLEVAEYTLYFLAKTKLLQKIPEFRSVMKVVADVEGKTIKTAARRKNLLNGAASVETNSEYWFLHASLMLKVLEKVYGPSKSI